MNASFSAPLPHAGSSSGSPTARRNGNGAEGGATADGMPSDAEVKRIRLRRRLARKTPEQRRKLQQYQRRHNEKDERLYYCDYCDLFISTRHKTWMTHLRSARHLDALQSYYDLVAHVESVWVGEVNRAVELARSRAVHRQQHRVAGTGAATPLVPQHVAPGIVVGGGAAAVPGTLPPPPPPPPPPPYQAPHAVTMMAAPPPTIRIGGKTLAAVPTAPPPPPL